MTQRPPTLVGADANGALPENHVFTFSDPPDLSDDERRALLGGKGHGLTAMVAAGIPVPAGFTLTTVMCRNVVAHGWSDAFASTLRTSLRKLEQTTGKRLGDADRPLLVSVRSGAAVSMPGMMDTVLNVGMNATVAAGLAAVTGDEDFAADTYRRALLSYAEVVLAAPAAVLAVAKSFTEPAEVETVLRDNGMIVPANPDEQVVEAVQAIFSSWNSARAKRYREVEGIDVEAGTAATIQAMVFGNLGDRSGTGVAFTRDPTDGSRRLVGDFLPRAQGEDVVSGSVSTWPLPTMQETWPDAYETLSSVATLLERLLTDVADIEFTVEDGTLWILQVRVGKRSPIAAYRCAVDMANDPNFPVDRAEAVRRVARYADDPPTIAVPRDDNRTVLASGVAACPGRASGVLCFDPDEAVALEAAGHRVVLAHEETAPADVHGMSVASGIFTLRGGLVSHAAVVARHWGIPAIVGAATARLDGDELIGPGGSARRGEVVTVDGTRGCLEAGTSDHLDQPVAEVAVIAGWASDLGQVTPSDTSTGADPTTPDDDFAVLHRLRIRGMAGAASLAASNPEVHDVERVLASLHARGLTRLIERRAMWTMTNEGRSHYVALLAAHVASVDLARLEYEPFLDANTELKRLCTDWQLRDGVANDHEDLAYDAVVISRLDSFHGSVRPTIDRFGDAVPWLAGYEGRLKLALDRLHDGDLSAFTGVMRDSYHDVWMELHEDLLVTQDLDRKQEGST